MVNELLEKAEIGELMEFIRQKARTNAAFGADLNEWLSNRYGEQGQTAEKYVNKVQWLFQRVVSLNKERAMRYRDDEYDVDWGALESGMLDILAELEACMADGLHSVVVEPIIEFYKRFHWCCDNSLFDQRYNFCDVHYECEQLLAAWIRHPATDDGARRELLCNLQQICRLRTYIDQGLYELPELMEEISSTLANTGEHL